MRRMSSQAISRWAIVALAILAACDRAEPLTAQKAQEIIGNVQFKAEPVYAEVPQKVWWNARFPKDDYDEKALRTLHNLEAQGLVTISDASANGTTGYLAKVTPKGFHLLGTAPSNRGPVFRAMICSKVYDGLRDFQRHPSIPTVGHAELVWHYTNPTPMYPLFETKINKPLDKPFVSMVSFFYKDHAWRFDVTVRKVAG